MERLKLGLIGAGNIMGTRHLPALSRLTDHFSLEGIMDPKGVKSSDLAKRFKIAESTAYERYNSVTDIPWFSHVDAVVIATPPMEHYEMCKRALHAGKHVLVEKPFVVSEEHGEELIELADRQGLILAVNQNFQYSSAFSRLRTLINDGQLGAITGFQSTQISNGDRRLPIWCEELPRGLFYDESPHVLYLTRAFANALPQLRASYVVPGRLPSTPKTLTIELEAGSLPCSIYINFESPICEWTFSVFGDKRYAVVDLFRDILIVLPSDGQHLMKEVLRTSYLATVQHWGGFVRNGFLYVRNRLDYGFVTVYRKFHEAITTGNRRALEGISAQEALAVNRLQHAVINSNRITVGN